jgi:elongation factor P
MDNDFYIFNIMLDFSDIKLGSVINFNGQPCVITACEFLRMQQRKPVKKCKLKNLISGNSMDYSFKSGESVEEADLRKDKATFMYASGDDYSFMITETYETVDIAKEMLAGKEGYLKEGLEVNVVYFNDNPISVELPIKVAFTITQTADVIKGNTVSDVMKDAVLETGMTVKVPGFIKEGEKVMINTVEDEYVGREV